jgi:RNA polymerase sigma factor (sigma-70 family)
MASPLLRLRSDEQLVALFRAGHDDAFRVIHDRYHPRLFAYTRQMLSRHHDAEDALQDVFVRVYTSLRASDRGALKLRPWLYRAAHNRCIDELRRPAPASEEAMRDIQSPHQDPIVQVVEREAFDSLVEDIRRLPVQQRSALLMRELGGAHYADIALALGTTVPAVKSLLVRARITLASALEARDTACATIREELTLAHDRRVRPNAMARAHLRDCAGCRDFRHELRGTSRQLAGLVPTLGPLGVLANALGFGGAGSGAGAGGGAAAVGGGSAIGGGALASAGILSSGHVATLIAAAVVTAGGAVEIQNTITPSRPSASAPAVGSSSSSNSGAVAPSATPPRAATWLTPRPSLTAPTIPSAVSSATAPPPATSTGASAPPPATSGSASPIRQPSITGIAAVSTSKTVLVTAIGHASITGTDQVSAVTPSTPSQSGSGSSATTSSEGSTGGSTDNSGSSATSASTSPQSDTTESTQEVTSSSSSPDSTTSSSSPDSTTSSSSPDSTTSSSSPDSTTWSTTGIDATAQ